MTLPNTVAVVSDTASSSPSTSESIKNDARQPDKWVQMARGHGFSECKQQEL